MGLREEEEEEEEEEKEVTCLSDLSCVDVCKGISLH